MFSSVEERKAYLTQIHAEFPEVVTQYGHYRVRVSFDDRCGVILSACDVDGTIVGETLIRQQDFEKMRTSLSLGWAYDRALVRLERCALESEGFFTTKGVA